MNSLTRQYLNGTLPCGFYYFTNGKEKYIVEHRQVKGIKGIVGVQVLERVMDYDEMKNLKNNSNPNKHELNALLKECKASRFTSAYVAFGGSRTNRITRFLKKGYSHCFLILSFNGKWVVIDPVVGYTDIVWFQGKRFFDWIDRMKIKMIKVNSEFSDERPFHLRPMNCVEIVKSFLCINKPFIFTPYQLYKYLIKKNGGTDKEKRNNSLYYRRF